ncbi:CPBP family intramembrane glutamic endopeptidase [Pseudooceanicola sp. HF7]|uniref:CPBP family intramembrane glutamic endopeptidase n=1 Tax=Pseudooceanicola sp. HF7 TaxID=2721560 RepID=UPI001431E98E|nr:CPBP family intramembrane glutamic endopeptidase [Pseudooceanicola sp. HF7]NIZ11145.1 CPBP family intramembrane metalloprotease [Pseudooceanicola sp. HF7]
MMQPPESPAWPDTPPALWRTGLGFGLFAALYLVMTSIWYVLLPAPADPQGLTLMMLSSFGAALAAVALMMQILHQRSLLTLIGPPVEALRQAFRVGRAVALLLGLVWLMPLPRDLAPIRYMPLGDWAALLPLALPLLAIQVTAEELLFRGYLQSRLSARFRSPLAWALVPSLVFGLLHYQGQAGANGWLFVLSATAFGLAAADLTARSGTLGPALALHFVNNVFAVLLMSLPDGLGGLALYHLPVVASDPALRPFIPIDLATTLVIWLAARLVLRR